MAFIDNVKGILQKSKNWIISLKDKLPFGKKKPTGPTATLQPAPIQPGAQMHSQESAQGVGAQFPQTSTHAQSPQPGMAQQQPVPKTNASNVITQANQVQQPGLRPGSRSQPRPAQGQKPQIDPMALKLVSYIRQYRQQGHKDDEILKFLVKHKWPEDIVRKALEFK